MRMTDNAADANDDAGTQQQDPKRPKRGRPRAAIDPAKLMALCQVHATDDEIAAHFGVCVRTIERLRARPEYAEVFQKGRADGRISLRRAQWQLALQGNATMQIWLGKQELGQRERVEHTGTNGGPIQITNVRAMLDGLSDEDFAQLARDAGVTLSAAEKKPEQQPAAARLDTAEFGGGF